MIYMWVYTNYNEYGICTANGIKKSFDTILMGRQRCYGREFPRKQYAVPEEMIQNYGARIEWNMKNLKQKPPRMVDQLINRDPVQLLFKKDKFVTNQSKRNILFKTQCNCKTQKFDKCDNTEGFYSK